MGCDIHTTFETYDKNSYGWRNRDTFKREGEGGFDSYLSNYDNSILDGRNYRTFAMLADVRNGGGFGGCDTGDRVEPIHAPRGIPRNAASNTVQFLEGMGDHSASHATLAELLAYDFTRTVKQRGVVSALQFHKWNRWGRKQGEGPTSYCGYISGARIKHITEADMIEAIAGSRKRVETLHSDLEGWKLNEREQQVLEQDEHVNCLYTRVEWTRHYYDLAGELLTKTIPTLLALATREGLSYDDVRIVYNFDS